MSAVHCCAHSEQLNVSCSRPGVPVRATSYSHIARPQLGHAGVLPTGCSDDLNKLDWGIALLLVLPTNPRQPNLFRASVCHGLQVRARVKSCPLCPKNRHSLGGGFSEIIFVSLPPTLPIGSDSPKQTGAQLNELDRSPGTEKNLPVIQLWDFQSCS